mmetsp:Transcript_10691/g.18002  ORF Transcript_10691/g.18002 Transcript_10691/m.18002 type:complete len:173 (-) Transcript_10691:903-1421(-)
MRFGSAIQPTVTNTEVYSSGLSDLYGSLHCDRTQAEAKKGRGTSHQESFLAGVFIVSSNCTCQETPSLYAVMEQQHTNDIQSTRLSIGIANAFGFSGWYGRCANFLLRTGYRRLQFRQIVLFSCWSYCCHLLPETMAMTFLTPPQNHHIPRHEVDADDLNFWRENPPKHEAR